MEVRVAIPEQHVSAAVLDPLLEGTAVLSQKMIEEGAAPTFEEAIKRGVQWKAEPPGHESFDHAAIVIARGNGDCDDLAAYRAGSLRASGEDPDARPFVYKTGPHRWHAVVERGDGSVEDPSQTAGMNVRKGSVTQGIPAAVVGCMCNMNGVNGGEERPYVAVHPSRDGWVGRVDIPWRNGRGYAIATTDRKPTPAQALGGAMMGGAIIGACTGLAEDEHLDKLFALSCVLKGERPEHIAKVVGRDLTERALESLANIAPEILHELKEHRAAVERGHRDAEPPFDVAGAFSYVVGARQSRGPSGGIWDTGIVGRGGGGRRGGHHRKRKTPPGGPYGGEDDDADDVDGAIVGSFWSSLKKGLHSVMSVAQGVVSLIPGVGTGIAAALGAGMALLDGGGALDVALQAAIGAVPLPQPIKDAALKAATALIHTHDLGDAAIAAIRAEVPAPAQPLFDTLAHIVLAHTHKQPTIAVVKHAPGKPPDVTAIRTSQMPPRPVAPVLLPVQTAQQIVQPAPPAMPARTRGAWVFA
jgi:hypothetical protein